MFIIKRRSIIEWLRYYYLLRSAREREKIRFDCLFRFLFCGREEMVKTNSNLQPIAKLRNEKENNECLLRKMSRGLNPRNVFLE